MAISPASLPDGPRGRALALGVLAVLLAVLWTGVMSPLLDLRAARQETLAERRALLGRMTALAASVPALRHAAAAAHTTGPAPQALIAGASDAIASATLQERVQAMAGATDASLASVEALPGEQAGALRRIGLRVSLSTTWPVLIRLLGAIEAAAPRMLIDDLQVEGSVIPVRTGEQRMEARFNVYAFRAGREPPS